MADKKDKKTPDNGTTPAISTSSSLDKPLLDEDTAEIHPEIDTSHLSLEEDSHSPQQDTAVDDFELNDDAAVDDSSLYIPPDKMAENKEPLYVSNPLAANTDSEPSNKELWDAVAIDNNAEEEQLELTTGKSDAEFDKEILNDETSNNTDYDDSVNVESDDESGNDNPIKSILDTVKKPESFVRSAWTNSSARRFLLNNVDSYRAKDEDLNMEAAIEKVYGGATEKKFDPKKFFKENLLFSFLLFLLVFLIGWKAAGIFFPDFMPGINDQIIETVKKTASIAQKEKPEVEKVIVTNEANKTKIEATLSHCLVEADAHKHFSAAFTKVGYEFTEPPLMLSYDEVSYSIKAWQGLNMGFYIKDAILRFRALTSTGLPVVQDARQTVANYNESLIDIGKQVNDLNTRIRNIKTSRGNQSTATINERIPLRIKLDELNARLAAEPPKERFTQLLTKLALTENILSGLEQPEQFAPGQITEYDPEWLLPIAETDSDGIGVLIEDKVLPTIQVPTEKLKNVYPKLTAFHLTELEKSLDDLLKLSSLIIYLPENILIPYRLELSGLNRRLNKLMKQELPEWLNFNRCLSATRAEALAAPE